VTFKDLMDSDAQDVFLNDDEFAEEITYTPSVGDAKTIKACIDRGTFNEQAAPDGSQTIKTARLWICTDATAGVAAPALQDTVTFDSLTWAVQEIDGPAGGMVLLTVRSIGQTEKSNREHRIRR